MENTSCVVRHIKTTAGNIDDQIFKWQLLKVKKFKITRKSPWYYAEAPVTKYAKHK